MDTKDNKTTTPAHTPEPEDGGGLILRFAKPYTFEEETFTEIDLSRLEDITAADMIAVQKQVTKGGNMELVPEMTLQYACILAARVSDQPIEFFTGLPAKEAIKLKNKVSGFIFGAD